MEQIEVNALRIQIEEVDRRLRATVFGFCFLGFIALCLLGFLTRPVASQPSVLRAQRIEVVDSQGRLRILLGIDTIGIATVSVKDPQGNERVLLAVLPDGTGEFTLRDLQG